MEGECWIWTGGVNGRGRPSLYPKGERTKPILAHRYSYSLHYDEDIKDLYVCHTCDEILCVNPEHLFLGTQQDNMDDMVSKGRSHKPKGELNGRSILTEEQVLFIRNNCVKRSPTLGIRALAKKFGVTDSTISDCLHNKSWRHL